VQTVNIYIIPGLVVGSVYAIAASGLVLSYTASGVLNLGYGAIAYGLALFYFDLHTRHHMGRLPAFVLCVFVVGPLFGALLYHVLFRWLAGLGFVASLIATIGLSIALPALWLIVFNPGAVFYSAGIAPNGLTLRTIGGVTLANDQIYGAGAAVVVAVVLVVLLRFTRIGLMMRAVFDSREAASLTGANPGAVSSFAWALSGSLAAVGGIVLAPLLGLTGPIFLSLTVGSLAAALVGGLRSISITFIAAIVIGLVGSAIDYINQESALFALGAGPALPFVVMLAVLLLRRQPIASGEPPPRAIEPPERFDPLLRSALKALPWVALLILLPRFLSEYWTTTCALGLIYAFIFLSYTVALGHAGLLPLCQTALVGFGGFVAGNVVADYNVPLLAALLVGAVGAAVAGGLLAAVGARLGTLEFGLLTFAFGLFADNFLFRLGAYVPFTFGSQFGTPSLFGYQFDSGTRLYYLVLAWLGLVLLALGWYRRQIGALFTNAVRMSPRIAAATSIRPRTTRTLAFALAAAIGAIGGGFLGIYQHTFGPGDVVTSNGLVWLATVVVFGIRSPTAAVAAGFFYALFPALAVEWLPTRWHPLTTIIYGVGALALAQDPRGLAGLASSAAGGLRAQLMRLRAT
jgi:branched-chain amino acid transport system permease protein